MADLTPPTPVAPVAPAIELPLEAVEPIPLQSEVFSENEEDAPKGSLATAYDPRADLSRYQFPKLSLLVDMPAGNAKVDAEEL